MDRLEAVDQTTVFLAVSSMAPNPGTTADWKRELWEEIMKDVKDQMSELTLLAEFHVHLSASLQPPRERSFSDGEQREKPPPGFIQP